jgi:hypothetical protein
MFDMRFEVAGGAAAEATPLATARGMQRVAWQAAGHALVHLARYATSNEGDEFAALEVAALFQMSERAARARLDLAVFLSTRLPRTLAAMQDGLLDEYRATKIADAVTLLSAEDAAAVEAEIVPHLQDLNPAQLGRMLTRVIRRLDANALQRRHEERMTRRRVDAYPTEDGCAALTVHGSAERIQLAEGRLDAIARQLKDSGHAGGRTLDQLRSDVALDLLAGKEYEHAKVTVLLTLPATTALGVDTKPGQVAGYGDIPAQRALALAGQTDATWRRILTDPHTGRVVDVGRRRYVPPVALREHVRADHLTCTGPGCTRPAHRCDLDHRRPFPAGPTSIENLHPACRRHHRAKTIGGWRVIKQNKGLVWISRAGYHYRHQPEPIAEPEPPPF